MSAVHGDNVNELVELALAGFPLPLRRRKGRQASQNCNRRPSQCGQINTRKYIGWGRSGSLHSISPGQHETVFIWISIEMAARYTLIDTAGLRRRGKVIETVEKFSVIKTLQAIEDANVVVLVLDARR